MSLDQTVTGLVYLLSVFVMFYLGRLTFNLRAKSYDLQHELVKNDNFALSLAVSGYYAGLLFALGGVLYGPSAGLVTDLIDIIIYGALSIGLLNASGLINDKIILRTFDNEKEIIQDRNAGTGAVEGANFLASGLIVAGAVSGEGGGIGTAVAFWALGQVAMLLATWIYNLITPYDIHEKIEADNVAVGVAFAGVLIAIGNIIRIASFGDFTTWQENISDFAMFVAFGLVLLPVVRTITDKVLLPGENLTDELVNQEHPNIGAGLIEAFSYVGASFLLGWIV